MSARTADGAETCQVFGITQCSVVVVIGGVAWVETELPSVCVIYWSPVLYCSTGPERNTHVESPAL